LLNFYKKALKIRNNTTAFQNGILEIDTEKSSKRIFAFYRLTDSEKYLIVLNMSKKHTSINHLKGRTILSTHNDINDIATKKMRPYEGRIVKISE